MKTSDFNYPSFFTPRRLDLFLVTALFVAGFVLHFLMLAQTQFDGLYGQDAYAYYDFGESLKNILNGGNLSGSFFWPLGYPILLALGFSVFGVSASTAQIINITLGSALSPLIFILARQQSLGRLSSVISAIVMLICGQALQSGIVVMSDIPALFWAVLSAVIVLRGASQMTLDTEVKHTGFSSLSYFMMASALLALASITRWLYLLLFIPWGISMLWSGMGRRPRQIGWVIIAALMVLLPQLAFSRATSAPTFNHAWVEGWSPSNAISTTFDNIDGHFEYQQINAIYYAQPFYAKYYLSPLFAPFLILGALWLLLRGVRIAQPNVRIKMGAVMALGWIVLPYIFLAGIPYQNIRFPLIMFPEVALMMGTGWELFTRWVKRLPTLVVRRLVFIALFSVAIVGAMQTLSTARDTIDLFITNQQRDKTVASWLAHYIPSEAVVYTFGLTLTLKHYTKLDVHELYYETPATLRAKWQHGQKEYLLINVWNIEDQWIGRDLQLSYHWLRDERGLTRLGRVGYYTLFRIGG
ncbi:MAG: phospholipid carrier-dependent glycosyltransferase [Anaerolineae bacterium]